MSNEENELLCPLCSELYEEDVREPVLLPRCGHVFCRRCLAQTAGTRGHFPCPTCRKRHLRPMVSQLPVNIDVLARAEVFRDAKFGICDTHGEVLEFWCRDCQSPLCGECPVKKGHDVVRTRLLLQEKKQEIQEQGNLILESVVEEKKKIIQKVKKCSLQLLRTCEESSLTTHSAEDVKVMMGDTKKTADVTSVLGYLARMKNILGSFRSASAEDGEGKPSRSRRTRKDKHQSQDGTNDSPNSTLRRRTTAAGNSAPGTPRTRTRNSQLLDTNNYKNTVTTTNNNNNNIATNGLSGGLETALLEASLWPLRCCAYAEDGRKAELKWEDKRLHMFALGNNMEDAHFMIKLSVLQALISQDNPEVFLDVAAGGQCLGRIYIRLWGHLRRAHNFLAMCTGMLGPSYRGARFKEVFARGIPGECLHAGEYLTPEGESAKGVIDNLEWDGKVKKPQRQGFVVGAGSGRPDRDACFDICTIENPQRNFACPFGEVVAGWDVVMQIVKHKPVRGVTMREVGVVIPDLSRST